MNTLKKYVIALLLLVLLVSGWEGVRSFLITNVIEPIAFVCWAIWRLIASVDQQMYWILLIGVCLLLILRLIPNRSDSTLKGSYNYTYSSGNRVEYWKTLLTNTVLGGQDAEDLQDGMKKLLVSAIRKPEEPGPIDLEKMLATGKIPLSLESRRFLFSPKRLGGISSTYSWFNRLSLRFVWLRRKAEKKNRLEIRSVDEILRWIETEMEIRNDK